jgi:predicted Zn-dependent peptidase
VIEGLLLPLLLSAAPQAAIPSRPEELRFDELRFEVPDPSRFRRELPNGVLLYIARDSTFPLVSLRIQLRQGSYLEPGDKVGLAGLTGTLLRTGGTEKRDPAAFDEEVEFLAAGISAFGGDARSGANLDCITPVLDSAMDLFFEMLRRPRFDGGRLAVEKETILEAMRQRNDDPESILAREWDWLLEGETFYRSRRMTKAHLDAIQREDLVEFHRKYWRPENMILSVSGDIEEDAFAAKLEKYLADWPGEGAPAEWPPPQPVHQARPGAYHAEKDIPQGTVVLGHAVPRWSDWKNPERAALQIMDHILGGSGFTSRITKRIRSDEGLAYDAGSSFAFDSLGPGSFTVSFQSKNDTVALATSIAFEEIERIRSEPASEEEIALAKASLIETFPRRFESAAQIAGTYAGDAFIGRSHDYWKTWREQVQAVTADDVLQAAKKYLKPEEIVFLVVGKWDEIEKGDADGRASMTDLFAGRVTHLPTRDPLTLKADP